MNHIFQIIDALDILDVLIVASIMYYFYRLLRHTRAVPVLIGLLILFIFAWSVRISHLETITWLFEVFSSYFIIGILITLQPEMRRFFYRIGEAGWIRQFYHVPKINTGEIILAVGTMCEDGLGALIVILNKTGLEQMTEVGVPLKAQLTKELLTTIFYDKSPLHDGAVIIKGEQIISASTYLPLSHSSRIKKSHGARHRAGLGISEESDALVIIVSEEKKRISIAFSGKLEENIGIETLQLLLDTFNNNELNEKWASIFRNKKTYRSNRNINKKVTSKKRNKLV